jgi:hypothetical protein
MTKEKQCTKCGETKPLSEFHKQKGSRDGVRWKCKTCSSIRKKQYHADNRERLCKWNQEYHKRNAARINANKQIYRKNNAARINANKQIYRKNNMDKIKARTKEYEKERLSPAIYEIVNTKNKKIYVGQTKSYKRRWSRHRTMISQGYHSNTNIREDVQLYELGDFEFRIVEDFPVGTPAELLHEKERELIDQYLSEGKELYNEIKYRNNK